MQQEAVLELSGSAAFGKWDNLNGSVLKLHGTG